MTGPMDISADQSSLLLTFASVLGGRRRVVRDHAVGSYAITRPLPPSCRQTEASDQKKAAPACSGLHLSQGCRSNRGDEDAASGTPPLAPTGGAGGQVPEWHHEHPPAGGSLPRVAGDATAKAGPRAG